ncbi:5-hydroxytryptamine receptor 3A-like [Sinocyclocheilus anshuiensis]|uniref:5-hydroxytryptamine receptor 3A-like n=1 Tax=Sinocyclocheilus anshuiensis TaxID=1608454 RepID=UPI0007BA6188|nr:PREDICTED: 5-hydroxytryptamine receptor 3A-like [Sinocyclocheilus anshuiensis]
MITIQGWVSDAENCSYAAYSSAYKEIFEHLGFDKTNILTTDMRPVYWSPTTDVYVDLYVTSIIDVNEKAQSLTTQVKIITAWFNDLFWWFEDFCGIQTIPIKKGMLWTPDILIKESIKTEFGTKESPYVQLIWWELSVLVDILSLTTACKMDLHRFPFDTQICNITLHSAVHTKEELTINPISDNKSLLHDSKEFFQAQGEWELVSIDIYDYTTNLLWNSQDLLIYQITIKRRPLLYVMNIILPVFVFLVLDVMSFFIDANGTEKLSFKVTLLLSVSVLLLILNDTLPSTADKIPLIGIYCSVIYSLIGISILETILVNLLKAKGAEKRSVETTAAITGRDNVGDLQSPPDSVRDQNGMQRSLCWTRVARIIDLTFLILYTITIIAFLSVLERIWFP